jgi:uncharacterized protein (TIGR03000 family)
MYSVVLLAALTSGGNSPAFHNTPYLPVVQTPAPSTFYGFSWCPYTNKAMAGNGFGACYGCCGGGGCIGGVGILTGTIGQPITPMPPPSPMPLPQKDPRPEKEVNRAPASVRVVVELPADARLFVDGKATSTTSAVRTFQTPDLVAGETYTYVLRAEVEVDGKPVTQTQRILLRVGEEPRIRFDDPRSSATVRGR